MLTTDTQVPVVAQTCSRLECKGRKVGKGGEGGEGRKRGESKGARAHRGGCGSSSGGPNHHGSWNQELWRWPAGGGVREVQTGGFNAASGKEAKVRVGEWLMWEEDLQGVALLPVALSVQEVSGDLKRAAGQHEMAEGGRSEVQSGAQVHGRRRSQQQRRYKLPCNPQAWR